MNRGAVTLTTISSVKSRTYGDSIFHRVLLCCLQVAYCLVWADSARAQDRESLLPKQDMTDQVKLIDGFRLVKLAGNKEIPNAFALAAHPSGDLVVSGPGYLRRLKFSQDSLAKVIDLPHPPAGGAQGLWCEGENLLFVGGEGVCRLKEVLGDLSDAQLQRLPGPDVLLKIDVGKEHQAHAIRKGPEGWWYLICGNDTELDSKFWSDKDSPVRDPEAGCLLRFNLEVDAYQVFAHGFRNAYDFDFGADGSVYVYDSDGERDISLPWYRPTRVFRVEAGDHAGWVNKSWKRPSYFPDMPIEVAALGRGSPTGVSYNGGQQMGKSLARKLFVGDWTFGRVVAIDVADNAGEPVEVLLSKGQFGFAVTDMVIGADGLLYVTVGGRGTEGGLFRIEPIESVIDFDGSNLLTSVADQNAQMRRRRAVKDSKSPKAMERIRKEQLKLGGCGGCDGMMAGYTAIHPQPKGNIQAAKLAEEIAAQLLKEKLAALRSINVGERDISDDNLRKLVASAKETDELFRLFAMSRIKSDSVSRQVFLIFATEKDPIRGIHLLNCYSFIGNSASAQQAAQISQFLIGLKRSLAKRGLNTDRNWEPRMKELVAALAKDTQIRTAILDSNSLGASDTLYLAEALINAQVEDGRDDVRSKVASVMLAWCRKYPTEVSARHVQLFRHHAEAASFLRSVGDNSQNLLSSTVSVLFEKPIDADRAIFVRGLGSQRLETKKQAAIGIRRLLEGGVNPLTFEETQFTFNALARLSNDGPGTSVKKQMMLLLKSSFGREKKYPGADLAQTKQFLEKRFGRPFKLEEDGAVDVDQWMAKIAWGQGDVERGKAVFIKAQCASCHQSGSTQVGSSALGPSLEGITKRFSKRAIFQAILEPNRDVADRYRAVLVETEGGDFMTGLKIYQSVDGITLLLADGSTARVNADQIADLKQSKKSLMPARLLDNLTPTEITDLWAFLKTL